MDEWDEERELDPEGWEFKRLRRLAISRLEWLIRHGKPMVSLLATKEVLDRVSPKPREPLVAIDNRSYTWVAPGRVEGGRQSSSSSPPSLSGRSTSALPDSTSSSATGDSGKPTWL